MFFFGFLVSFLFSFPPLKKIGDGGHTFLTESTPPKLPFLQRRGVSPKVEVQAQEQRDTRKWGEAGIHRGNRVNYSDPKQPPTKG